jgi:predicted nucleotidyltransferase
MSIYRGSGGEREVRAGASPRMRGADVMREEVRTRLRSIGGEGLVTHTELLLGTTRERLGETLRGAALVGSLASGDADARTSDLDLLLVVVGRHDERELRAFGERLADLADAGPLRGLEAVVYRAAVLAAPTYPLPYELNVNGGQLPRVVETAGSEPFWFLLDVAAAREHALPLAGPPAAALIAPVPDHLVLAALRDSVRWHDRHGGSSPDAVLNACRTWHWLERRAWVSKTAAGEWAVEQRRAPAVVRRALTARRSGSDAPLDPRAVADFLRAVAGRVPTA